MGGDGRVPQFGVRPAACFCFVFFLFIYFLLSVCPPLEKRTSVSIDSLLSVSLSGERNEKCDERRRGDDGNGRMHTTTHRE